MINDLKYLQENLNKLRDIIPSDMPLENRISLLMALQLKQNELLEKSLEQPKIELLPQPPYNTRKYALDSARTGEEVPLLGQFIAAYSDGSLDNCYITIEDKDADPIYLSETNPITFPLGFTKFWLTTDAQSGKYLRLLIGRKLGVEDLIWASVFTSGKMRLVTASGDDITDDTADAVKALLVAGSDLIGKVAEPAVVETPFTGTGNVVVGTAKIEPGAAFKLTEIELHLSAAPTTGTQNLVITKDDGSGTVAYDVVILTIDLVANAVTDLVIRPSKTCKSTDVITAAWTNTNGVTYGLIFKHQLV